MSIRSENACEAQCGESQAHSKCPHTCLQWAGGASGGKDKGDGVTHIKGVSASQGTKVLMNCITDLLPDPGQNSPVDQTLCNLRVE